MKNFKWWKALLLWSLATVSWADVSPVSLTLFGEYGEPVDPPALSNSAANGFGFNALVEWNATSYTSFGLSFEQTTFYGAPDFTIPMVNFESRVFPLENEKDKISPYVYGGLGLNLASAAAWQGPVQLKAGIGSKVALIPPLFFDVAVGSHWLQPPNGFQYVDIRSGLSISFGFKEKPQPTVKPAEKPMAATTPTTTPTFTPSPIGSPQTIWTPMPTPMIEIPAAPVTTLAQAKKYYRLGMNAFRDGNYALSLKLLKKSLWVREHHKAPYFYAETYATMGVIYQFHAMKVKNHDQKALDNYKKALAIDPTTKSAKHYYRKLKAKVAREKKTKTKSKWKPVKTPTDLSIDISTGDSSAAASVGNNPALSATPLAKSN